MKRLYSPGDSAFAIRRVLWALPAVLALQGMPVTTLAKCQVSKFELPVTMQGMRALISARVNGTEALFIADSGAFYSVMSPADAAQFKLPFVPTPYEMRIEGIAGGDFASVATVKTFTIGGVPVHNVEFIVAGNQMAGGAVGVLGDNVLGFFDTEYDLANGMIRLMKPRDCAKTILAYWAVDKPYSVVDIERGARNSPQAIATAYLNGEKIRVLFDTGAATSQVKLRTAAHAGVKPGDPGVVPGGSTYGAAGQQSLPTWIAPFKSFKIGAEEILNTHLRIADIHLDADMLLGADFFLSHRIYISTSQRKAYFTYNGGPVFNLTTNPVPAPAAGASPTLAPTPTATPPGAPGAEPAPPAAPGAPAAASATPAMSASAAAPTPAAVSDVPTDAAGFARRGTAFTARREYERAIADLTRAVELEPNGADYFYERGLARLGNRQEELALADFDQALKLKPDDVQALASRAELRLRRNDRTGAITDLDAADRLAAKEAMIRLTLGGMYGRAGEFARAVGQYDLWLDSHRYDFHAATAFNGRCWARAQLNRDLDKALKDCNAAVRMRPETADFLDSRGLVRLRRGELDAAIADYDTALKLNPRIVWSLYGRGVARLRKGETDAGRADIAAASKLQPHIAELAGERGLAP